MPGTAPAATVPLTRPAEEVMHTPSHQPATSRQSAKPAATSSRKVTEHKSFGNADEIREFMSGNLCRCAAYPQIVAAVQQAAPLVEQG